MDPALIEQVLTATPAEKLALIELASTSLTRQTSDASTLVLRGHLFRPSYRSATGERKHSAVYWWKFGKQRAATGCRDLGLARAWVAQRLVEMGRAPAGTMVTLKGLLYDDLEKMLEDRWTLDGRTGMLKSSGRHHLRKAFAGSRVDSLTTDRITAYAVQRTRAGAAPATVNLELKLLRRGFSLAREAGRLSFVPVIKRLKGAQVRTGTVERGDFEAILAALPERYRPPIVLLHATGWRLNEALSLTWDRVDLEAKELRLDTSKNGAPRVFAYDAVPALVDLFRERRRVLGPYVFPGRAGARVDRTTLQKAWRRACIAAGCPRALIHDLRRTMVRDMRRAGVSLAVAMNTVGHANLAVHQGYSVVAREDQVDGLAALEAYRESRGSERKIAAFNAAPRVKP
jgi:integrase